MSEGKPLPVGKKEYTAVRSGAGLSMDESVFRGLYEVYLQIAAWLETVFFRDPGRVPVLGINGAQGTGKTTAAIVLENILECVFDRRVCRLSIDDIYLTREQRTALARDVHPLLATRGVPGTHDVERGVELIRALKEAGPDSRTPVVRFDKARDDRRPESRYDVFSGRPDGVILEGWCVGAMPQPEAALEQPVNELERLEDHDRAWRHYVNARLADYRRLFEQLDYLIMLKAPSFEQVYRWRLQQEQELTGKIGEGGAPGAAIMDELQLQRFVSHFERLTRWMLEEMPGRADLVLELDGEHRIEGIRLNDTAANLEGGKRS